jgi:hypothetical protein
VDRKVVEVAGHLYVEAWGSGVSAAPSTDQPDLACQAHGLSLGWLIAAAPSRSPETDAMAAGNPQAAAALDSLHFPLVKFKFQVALIPGRKLENVEEHRDLLAAIEARRERHGAEFCSDADVQARATDPH